MIEQISSSSHKPWHDIRVGERPIGLVYFVLNKFDLYFITGSFCNIILYVIVNFLSHLIDVTKLLDESNKTVMCLVIMIKVVC